MSFRFEQAWCGPGDIRAEFQLLGSSAADSGRAELVSGLGMPGIPNLHSHAFQRVMAGLAERRAAGRDDFWSWRETMYRYAQAIGPDHLKAIAAQLYVEMLEQGYTQVCEFHYLHHQRDGRPYAEPAAMSLALIEAAREVGIGLTLLPTLYMTGHFDGRPLSERQRRFGHADVDSYLRLLESLLPYENECCRVGVALHSLRAVPPDALAELVAGIADERFRSHSGQRPLHIHIAEQTAEVADCIAVRGAPPVRWLLDNVAVDERWCLVHATHMVESEVRDLAASGATVAICPTTEANLGDGLFPLADYLAAGGRLGIGSDSHVSTSPVEELRWLEYGQRLLQRQRIVAADAQGRAAEALLKQCVRAGARVTGDASGGLWADQADRSRLDFITVDTDSAELASAAPDQWVECWVFCGNRPLVNQVVVDGRLRVSGGVHQSRNEVSARYIKVADGLRDRA